MSTEMCHKKLGSNILEFAFIVPTVTESFRSHEVNFKMPTRFPSQFKEFYSHYKPSLTNFKKEDVDFECAISQESLRLITSLF